MMLNYLINFRFQQAIHLYKIPRKVLAEMEPSNIPSQIKIIKQEKQKFNNEPQLQWTWQKRVENIIYNHYIQEKSVQSPKLPIQNSKTKQDLVDQKKQSHQNTVWQELRKEFSISMAGTICQLYTNQRLISWTIHYLAGLQLTQTSKKIIKNMVQYYDPSRAFIKSLIQSLVPNLEEQQQCELNKINVILYTLNVLFSQQSPQNPKFNSYIYLFGGQGLKVQEKVRWPFEKSGTICLWYNMSEDTKQCKLFQIVNAQKTGYEIVLRNKKIYFEKIKQQKGFSLIRNDSAFLCEALANTDVKLWIQFQIKKKYFQKALFINVIMNNFVLNNIELDYFNPISNDYSITLFKNFHGKVSSVLIFTQNLAKQVQNLGAKQGFTYENDIKNFSYMFDNILSHVYLLYTSIRAKTQFSERRESIKQDQDEETEDIFSNIPSKTIVFDAINRRNGIIGPQACTYHNISIQKKEISLYGSLQTYIGFFDLLKIQVKMINKNIETYTQVLGQLIHLIKNIFQSKATSIEEADRLDLFRIMSNFFIQTEMKGFSEELTPKLKELYVSLNNRCTKQKFFKKFFWGIPAGEFLELQQLEYYIKLVKGIYIQQIQNSLNIFGIKDIIYFLLDNYDNVNCCFEHKRTNSIETRKKIRFYQQVLGKYFDIIQQIIEIKMMESHDCQQVIPLIRQITSCFSLNVSPCFIEALVKFLSDTFAKNDSIQKLFLQEFQSNKESKMGLFSALANSYSWRTKGNLIELILHIFGVKMFRQGGQKDLMTLCIRYPTLTSRFSSIKSQDIERSVDMSEDKISLNSTNVKSYMAMRPLCMQDLVLLNDEQIIKIIWQWGTSKEITLSKSQQNQNPAILILIELYKGSTYNIRKMITNLILSNIEVILFTPDLMAWVIQCLLIAQFDSINAQNSDEILFKLIQDAKRNLLKLISSYRVSNEDEQDYFQTELDIIKLILISVKSKYTSQISNYYNIVFLQISYQLIANFYQGLKISKIQSQEQFMEITKTILSNCFKCLLQYFISKNNDDFQFEEESQMEENQKQFNIMLQILQKIYDILIYLTAKGTPSLILEQGNAKRNQIIFEMLFIEEGKGAQIQLLCFIFVCLQGLFDNYDEVTNDKNCIESISKKKTILTLVKKYLKYLIEISENSGGLKIQKFQNTLTSIFLNTLGFLQSKFYQYHFGEGIQFKNGLKNIEDIKNLILNIFVELIELMKYIQQCGCSKHKSFYELMKPKKKHKNLTSIKNLYPMMWKKVDDKILQFYHLKNEVLREQQAKNRLQEHLKMKRLYTHTISIEKAITKKIDKFLQKQKKLSEVTEKKSVLTYNRNENERYKILSDFEQSIALFMFQSNNKQRNEQLNRKIQTQQMKRDVQIHTKQIWNHNRIFQGFWTNHHFYNYSQNVDTYLYDNDLNKYYRRVRSDRQTKYLLTPIISIKAKVPQSQQDSFFDQQIFLAQPEDDGEKVHNQQRKSEKYLQVGFQFLKKKVIEKIKKSANIMKEKGEQTQQRKIQHHIFKEILLIQQMKVRVCTLKLDNNWIQLQFRSSTHLQHISLLKNKQRPDDQLCLKWSLYQIQSFQMRKYMLKPNAIEIFFKDKNSIMLSFYGKSESSFPKFVEYLQLYKKIDISNDKLCFALKQFDPWKLIDKFTITQQWIKREISNFHYIISLNILGGRTNCDLNQYFIFPWILSDYRSSKFRKDQNKYRDLEKNMGALGSAERLQKFIEIKNAIQENHREQFAQSHFFGFHYSNLPIVLQYLIRVSPYAEGAMQLQGGKFDIPDRLFTSVSDSFKNAVTEMSDVRELIPQFYYFPQFFINCEDFDFGIQHNSKRVNNVQLPDGYSNAYDFIEAHRQEFQSQEVSSNLHKWIDLIFGYKQNGKQAQSSFNKFHYLSYEANAGIIFNEEKTENKESVQSQIAYFGKVPSQLFTKLHPKRTPLSNSFGSSQYTVGYYIRANPFINQASVSQSVENQLIRHENGLFSKPNQACIHFSYSQQNKKYIIFRRDGKGVIFQNDKTDKSRLLSITNAFHFQIFFDKYEQVYIIDETIQFQHFPITSLWSQHLFIGGLWGGKIIRYDIIMKQFQVHSKHSDTVTALCSSEELQAIISGSISGQLIIWQYLSKTNSNSQNGHNQRKLIYKNKIGVHYGRINNITINNDLRAAVVSSQDGLLSLIDIERYQVIRIIKIGLPIRNSLLLSYPYYMFFISCTQNKQFCYSLNGQFLQQANYENLHQKIRVCTFSAYQQRVLLKMKDKTYFSLIKLPQLRQITTVTLANEDNEVLYYHVSPLNSQDIQILFNTCSNLVYCNSSATNTKNKASKKGKIQKS